MRYAVFIPMVVGLGSVLQGTLNRRVALQWTLPGAAMLNAVVMAVAAAAVFGLAVSQAGSLQALRTHAAPFAWWFLVPGLLGLVIVMGTPWALAELGALATFALIIASQLVCSAAWDAWVEHLPLNPLRAGGAALTLVGAVLATWKR